MISWERSPWHLSSAAAGAAAAPAARSSRARCCARKIPSAADGESVPVIGMGTWNTFDVGGGAAERAPLKKVLEAVLRRRRAADRQLADVRQRRSASPAIWCSSSASRSSTFYATKVWTSGRDKGLAQIEHSLRSMKTPRLDLLQIHNLLDWRTHARDAAAAEERRQDPLRRRHALHSRRALRARVGAARRALRLRAVQLLDRYARRGAAAAAVLPGARHRRAHQSSVRGRRAVHASAQPQAPRLRAGDRLHELGAGVPEVHRLAPGRDVRDPGDLARRSTCRTTCRPDSGRMPDAALRERMAKDFDGSSRRPVHIQCDLRLLCRPRTRLKRAK